MQSFPRILGRHYFAIFILASVTLSYQILITRFFSVMLYYHFAFAAISLAMLGLTRGAMQVYKNPARYAPERVGPEFANHAAWFAITGTRDGGRNELDPARNIFTVLVPRVAFAPVSVPAADPKEAR